METNKKMKISFFGFGTFNCALAHYLTEKFSQDANFNFFFWDMDNTIFDNFIVNQTHPYHFTEKKFNKNLQGCSDKETLIEDADLVILGIDAQNINTALKGVNSLINKDTIFLIISKGIDNQTHELLSSVVQKNILNNRFNNPIAVFSGGTIASDIINQVPLIAEIACSDESSAKRLADLLQSDTLQIYTNTDILAVELAGALKNFISIGVGICEGLNLPIGTQASFITRATLDIYKIAKKMGASDITFLPGSASFWSDIMLSAFGQTRNKEFGKRLCLEKKTPSEIINEMKKEHKTVEGYFTVKSAYALAQENKVITPLLNTIYQILYENAQPQKILQTLIPDEKK